MIAQRLARLARWRGMKPWMFLAPLAVLAACSPDPVANQTDDNVLVPTDDAPLTDGTPAPTVSRSPAAVVDGAIPASFRGEWSASAAGCGREGEDSRLVITADELRFYESIAEVTGVTGNDAAIRVTARYSGEGQQWTETRSLTLSPDGQTLRADGMTRVRCA